MTGSARRPEDLPDFERPPLNEVVMGVQFEPAKGYSQIRAGEVWQIFRENYPRVVEQPALQPSFETFGLPGSGAAFSGPGNVAGNLSFVSGALHDRFWFMRPSGDELIQFQQDRLLHNWRKVGDQLNEYPRFENMLERFENELLALEQYVHTLAPQTLSINQCEISYINHIGDGSGVAPSPEDWLSFATFERQQPDDYSVAFREVVRNVANAPVGRFICECSSGINPAGKPIMVLALTVRGRPSESSIQSSLEFMKRGRILVVSKFAELTTSTAHQIWGRRQ